MKGKALLLLSLGLLFLIQARGISWSQTTTRVSVDWAGDEAVGPSFVPSISADGKYVAFESDDVNLVGGDSNASRDIFVRDRQTPTTIRVSVDSGGIEQNGDSFFPSISSDGRYVAFQSNADLVGGDANPFTDIFVRDLVEETTTLVSVDSAEFQPEGPNSSPSISVDGNYVAFQSEADLVAGDTSFFDIFVRDLVAGTTILVSVNRTGAQADNNSYSPSISADGRYVAFESIATDLVQDGTNGSTHIFVRDLVAGTTTLVSVDSSAIPIQGDGDSFFPSISGDGRYVAFESLANNLVTGDTNGRRDIFVRDLVAKTTTLVSVDSSAIPIQGDGDSFFPSISSDGRYVAFQSDASNLVDDDTNDITDIFVHDLLTGATNRVSADSTGIQGDRESYAPSISSDGRYVAFQSDASNLLGVDNDGNDNDTNNSTDIFLYERESLPPTVDSTSPAHNANGVAVGSSVTATFSEPMNGSTIDTNTFTLDNGVTGTVTYDANSTTATFTPTSKLDYDTTYTATITAAVRDLADNPMLADFIWTFTTKSENKNSGGSGHCFISTAASDWANF